MKISQEDAILIKNLYLSMQYGARRLLRELLESKLIIIPSVGLGLVYVYRLNCCKKSIRN